MNGLESRRASELKARIDRRRDTEAERAILGVEPVRCAVQSCGAVLETVLQQMNHREEHEVESLGEPLDDTRPRLLRLPL